MPRPLTFLVYGLRGDRLGVSSDSPGLCARLKSGEGQNVLFLLI